VVFQKVYTPMGCLNVITITLFLVCKLKLFLKCLTINIKIKDEAMNWKDIASAGKSISRMDNLELQQSTRDALEAVMVSKAAAGRPQEMALIAQTIEKVNTQADLKQLSADLGTLIATMKNKEVNQTVEPVEDTVTLTKAQFNELKEQLSK